MSDQSALRGDDTARSARPRVLAHRGANRVAPENTIEAFRAARALGADGVELDVHRSADGVLVVHHDAEVPGLGVTAERSLAEIRAAQPALPTLEEVLDACPEMLVNIEVKNLPGDPDHDPGEGAVHALVELLAARSRRDDVLVSSFNLQSIDRVHELDPSIQTGFLTMVGFDPLDALPIVHDRGHHALHPDVRSIVGATATAVVERAGALGITINVWTVNDEAEMRRLDAAGVDGIVTDVPDVARRVLDGD
jgi:glycerophosphoryl diester phosphodiesterase